MGVYIKGRISGPTYDSDAQAFFTASGITDNNQRNAVNILVVELKFYGIWNKMKAIYPFVGGTASTHKWNLKDPQDTNAAFRLVFNGGWTHSAEGVQPNGTNGWANTFYNLSVNSTSTNISAGAYNRTNLLNHGGLTFGADTGASFFAGTGLSIRNTDGNTYWAVNDNLGQGIFSAITDARGFYIQTVQSTSAANKQFSRNGSVLNTVSKVNSDAPNLEIAFGALNRLGSIIAYDVRQTAFLFFGNTLSTTEIQNFYTVVQAYQTRLNRQV